MSAHRHEGPPMSSEPARVVIRILGPRMRTAATMKESDHGDA